MNISMEQVVMQRQIASRPVFSHMAEIIRAQSVARGSEPRVSVAAGERLVQWLGSVDKKYALAGALAGLASISGGAGAGTLSPTSTVYFHAPAAAQAVEFCFADDAVLDDWLDVEGDEFEHIFGQVAANAQVAVISMAENPVTEANAEEWARVLTASLRD